MSRNPEWEQMRRHRDRLAIQHKELGVARDRSQNSQGFVAERAFGAWGIAVACVEVFLASIVASSVAFILARRLCANSVRDWTLKSQKLQIIETLMLKQGFRMVLMLRLASVLPFGHLNYFMSAMRVSYRSFVLGSIGLTPYIFTCKLYIPAYQ